MDNLKITKDIAQLLQVETPVWSKRHSHMLVYDDAADMSSVSEPELQVATLNLVGNAGKNILD